MAQLASQDEKSSSIIFTKEILASILPRRNRFLLLRVAALCVVLYFAHSINFKPQVYLLNIGRYLNGSFNPPQKALIVASLNRDNVSWVNENLSGWEKYVYVVDEPTAKYTVPQEKGGVASPYLTYLIDHYYNLPKYMIFIHANRFHWHNDEPDYDIVPLLNNLQLKHVEHVGYANLRCDIQVGCQNMLKPRARTVWKSDEDYSRALFEMAQTDFYHKFLPERVIPDEIGSACCSQFAVTKEKVLKRPLSDYEAYRQWIWDSDLPDNISGNIFEFLWHIIMGKPAAHCPNAEHCYCQTYGACDSE